MTYRQNPFGGTLVLQGTRTSHMGALSSPEGSVRVGPAGIQYPLGGYGETPQSRSGEPIVLVDARPAPEEIEDAADEAVRQAVEKEMRGPKKLIKFGVAALVLYGLAKMTGVVR